jgi:hypothetical protein
MMLHLDTLSNIIGAGIIVLIALGMILWFALRRRIKAGKDGVTIGGAESPCAPYIAEHAASLARLEAGVSAINVMQLAQTRALDILLGLAEGEAINGQVKAARAGLTRAEGFKDATETMGAT